VAACQSPTSANRVARASEVVGPDDRQAGEREERRSGGGDHERQRADLAPAQRAPAERDPGGGQHEVERQQPPQAAVVGDLYEEGAAAVERERRPERRCHQHRHRHDHGAPRQYRRRDA
jgi:hypothetical protein